MSCVLALHKEMGTNELSHLVPRFTVHCLLCSYGTRATTIVVQVGQEIYYCYRSFDPEDTSRVSTSTLSVATTPTSVREADEVAMAAATEKIGGVTMDREAAASAVAPVMIDCDKPSHSAVIAGVCWQIFRSPVPASSADSGEAYKQSLREMGVSPLM